MTIDFDVVSSPQPQLLHKRGSILEDNHAFLILHCDLQVLFLFWITKMYEEFVSIFMEIPNILIQKKKIIK